MSLTISPGTVWGLVGLRVVFHILRKRRGGEPIFQLFLRFAAGFSYRPLLLKTAKSPLNALRTSARVSPTIMAGAAGEVKLQEVKDLTRIERIGHVFSLPPHCGRPNVQRSSRRARARRLTGGCRSFRAPRFPR